MQQGSSDYTSQYYPHHYPSNPNPNPMEYNPIPNPILNQNPIQPPFASAPPYSYPQTEFPNYPPNPYPNYSHTLPEPTNTGPPTYNPTPFTQDPYYSYDYNPTSTPNPPAYENSYETGGYFGNYENDGLGDESGVYAYDGGKVEPYGARGTGGYGGNFTSSRSSSSEMKFDDFGRPIGAGGAGSGVSGKEEKKIVRAVPKMESSEDVKNGGVQKFRVKLLPEGANVSTTDVLCQIGLDGIRMLDPGTSRILRIYPLENVTRWEVLDSSIFAFWSKSPVDIDPRRIRLQSNSYTTSTILDTVTAATVQLKEMGGKDSLTRSADTSKPSEQATEKKKGLTDWMNLIKPGNEEKDHWVPDEAVTKCTSCATDFGAFVRKHHCRNCGDIFCDKCTQGRIALTADEQAQQVRVCDRCMAEVSQRLTNAKERANNSTAVHSHVDLARKLQEEMEKNRKSTPVGSKSSDSSGRRMREVACPTCTVHLQVQVPASGSETIECGVCQQPFLVSAH